MNPEIVAIIGAAAAGHGLSKPAMKLIETVASAVGILYEPTRIKRKGRAESHVIRMKGEANADAIRSKAHGEADRLVILARGKGNAAKLANRATHRIANDALRHQLNREKIVRGAFRFLPAKVSTTQVEADWIAQYFEQCQDISNAKMQSIWSQILAGEVARPGRFSLRTLHAVKMLRQEDAALFSLYCRFVWQAVDGPAFAVIADSDDQFWSPERRGRLAMIYRLQGITSLKRLHLQSLNLIIQNNQDKSLTVRTVMGTPTILLYHGDRLSLLHRDKNRPVRLPVEYLTDIGSELAPIPAAAPHAEYESLIVEQMKEWGFSVDISD